MSASKRADALRAITSKRAEAPAPGSTAMRTTPMRTTVDLDPALWADLQGWLASAQAAKRRKISSAEVLRALIEIMVADLEFSAKVRDRLK